MKMENNWRFKSLNSLEKKPVPDFPKEESSIVQRSWRLRNVPINEFQVDDIRFLIIQGIGLKYLLPEALDLLRKNLLIEGNYYEGDLLNSVLSLEPKQWKSLEEYWYEVDRLIREEIGFLRTVDPSFKIDNFYSCRPTS